MSIFEEIPLTKHEQKVFNTARIKQVASFTGVPEKEVDLILRAAAFLCIEEVLDDAMNSKDGRLREARVSIPYIGDILIGKPRNQVNGTRPTYKIGFDLYNSFRRKLSDAMVGKSSEFAELKSLRSVPRSKESVVVKDNRKFAEYMKKTTKSLSWKK